MGTENLYTRPGQPIKASSASLRSDCGGNKRITVGYKVPYKYNYYNYYNSNMRLSRNGNCLSLRVRCDDNFREI